MQPNPQRGRNWKGWAVAGLAVLVLVLILVLWGMRPSRQGQPGQPAQHDPAASASTCAGTHIRAAWYCGAA